MASRAELRAELDARGIPWTTRMRVADLEALIAADDATLDHPQQLHLEGIRAIPKGPAEKAAGRDLEVLRELGVIPTGSLALEVSYRRLARQLDAADDEGDRYGVINASAALRTMRAELGVTTGSAGDDALERAFEAILAQISD